MNDSERKTVGAAIVALGVYYCRNLDQATVKMMVDDLCDLSVDEVIGAMSKYRRDPANRMFPLPAQLRTIARPTPRNEVLAIEAASRVRQAVSKFGWPNPQDARNFIGELGWRAVERFGGWEYVCQNLGTVLSPDTFHAQIRDLCKSTLELGQLGLDDRPVQLSGDNRVTGLIENLATKKELK